ncbi:PD40 domain-containing protein, partial [candidate division FCPU426 bacterium]|nr:PD40 domain-containing protein [candidate division FCPU426 bacterium]
MRRISCLRACILGAAIIGLLVQSTWAGVFGKNKLQTRDLRWHIFETEHFEIHYYPEEEALAREVCALAEAAYRHNTRLLREKTVTKTPLFIYRNQIDFQQTNILPHVIGVGTGGFTEAYKNRVALPAPDSPRELREVIFHEFTHVLQFNILYGEGIRSFRVYKGYLIPLWIIEGMAEYAAQDWDHYADMVVRDAVINDTLIPLTLMDGFSHLEDVYLAYKESQLAIQYIAERFGEDKLAAIFKKFKSQISISQILRETVGLGLGEFNRDFMHWVKQKYWVQTHQRKSADDFAAPLETGLAARNSVGLGASWSQDGRNLAYLSNRDQVMRVYIKPRGQASRAYPITRRQFENISTRGRPLTWSPDGSRLAFVAREEGSDHLYLLTLHDHALERRILPVDTFFSPAWSPDGKQIAVAGVKNGVGDIYLYDLDQGTLNQFTGDRYADDAPAWSPDGRALVYASERGEYWQLVWSPMQTPAEPSRMLTMHPSQHKTPSFSADGKTLYYSGDRNGIFNVFSLDLERLEARQWTDINSGAFQPDLSPDGKRLAFTVYQGGGYALYLMPVQAENEKTAAALPDSGSQTVFLENNVPAQKDAESAEAMPAQEISPSGAD